MMNQVFEIPTCENYLGSKSTLEIREPHCVPHELSHILSFNEYKHIVMTCKSELEAKRSYRIILIIPIIVVSIIFGVLFAKNVTSHMYLVIGLIIFMALYIIISIYLFSKWSSRFNDKLDELNHLYSNKGIRIEKKVHYSHKKKIGSSSTIKLYLYYTAPFNSSPIGMIVPPPPPMYILNQQQQFPQIQYQQQYQPQQPTNTYNIVYDNNNNINPISNHNISIDPQPIIQQQQQQQQQNSQINEKTPLI